MPESATSVRREVATLAPPAMFLAGVLEVAARSDAGHRAVASAALVVILTQVVPGMLVWRLVRPVHGWLVEDLVMGLVVGVALAVPSQILAVALGQRWLAATLPIALALALIAVPGTRARIQSASIARLPWAWGVIVTVSAVGPLLDVLRAFAIPLRWRGWANFHVDVPFQQAVTGEVLNHFPPHYPQAALEPLAGHWFAYAWTSQIATVSGADIGTLLWRFNPALLMLAAPIAIAVAAMRLSGRASAGPVAALLAYLLPDVVPWGTPLVSTPLHNTVSPTQQLAAVLFVGLVTLVTLRWRGQSSNWSLPVLVLLLAVTGATKGSTLPVLLVGMLCAVVAMTIVRGRALWTVALDTLLTALTLIVLTKTVFGDLGQEVSLDFGRSFADNVEHGVIGPALTVASATDLAVGVIALLTILLGSLAGFGLLGTQATRRDPLTWLLIGGGAAGLGAMVMLTAAGSSQIYFYKSAESLIALGAAWGAAVLLNRAGSRPALPIAGIATGVVTFALVHVGLAHDSAPGLARASTALAVLAGLIGIGSAVGARATRTRAPGAVAVAAVALIAAPSTAAAQAIVTWDKPPVAVRESPTASGISFDDVRALRWLRDHSDPDDVIATNRHCRGNLADPCDRRQFFIGAYTERRVLIEGWTYTSRAAKLFDEFGHARIPDAKFWDPGLIALNDGFIADPSAARADRLWDLGVRWIVVWPGFPHTEDLSPFAQPARRGATVTIYRLERPSVTS